MMIDAKTGISGCHQLNGDVLSAMMCQLNYTIGQSAIRWRIPGVAQHCGESSGWSCFFWLTRLHGGILQIQKDYDVKLTLRIGEVDSLPLKPMVT